jgi:hypothetical protein
MKDLFEVAKRVQQFLDARSAACPSKKERLDAPVILNFIRAWFCGRARRKI